MKQSSTLLLASLLSINFASFAMDHRAPGAETPIQAFKREVKELDIQDFKHLSICLDQHERSCTAFLSQDAIPADLCKALTYQAAWQCRMNAGPILALIQKYSLPKHTSASDDMLIPDEASCLHPIVMSVFSQKFQTLIQKRKTALIQQKIEDGEEIEKWTTVEKQAFGLGLMNTELKALKAELRAIQTKITPFHSAIQEVKAARLQQPQNEEDELIRHLLMAMIIKDMRRNGDDNAPKP